MAKNKHIPILSEDELDYGVSSPVAGVDKINSLAHKEQAMIDAGVTRREYMRVIADALRAKKQIEIKDDDGRYIKIWVDDPSRQQWGAEMTAKLKGDLIDRKEIEAPATEIKLTVINIDIQERIACLQSLN